jgi:hypothetical protein
VLPLKIGSELRILAVEEVAPSYPLSQLLIAAQKHEDETD